MGWLHYGHSVGFLCHKRSMGKQEAHTETTQLDPSDRDWLIPWFVPKLGRLKTVAASGTSRVSALVQALAEMLIFSHLEQMYKYRAWVLVDGDESGKQVVEKLRAKYASWPGENF